MSRASDTVDLSAVSNQPLKPSDVERVLERLGDAASRLVLVGGQALAFWHDRLAPRLADDLRAIPSASADVDFLGDRDLANLCAERLRGSLHVPSMDHPGTPQVGVVVFLTDDGKAHILDILETVFGLKAADIFAHSAMVRLAGGTVEFRVMDPVDCLLSRIHNIKLSSHRNSHAANQLELSLPLAREYLLDLIDTGELDEALEGIERLFSFCVSTTFGQQSRLSTGIDAFAAVVVDSRLPSQFREQHYPQMLEHLCRARPAGPALGVRTLVRLFGRY
jgi:hypothetical protein